jgi:hypothetical protein
MYGVEDPSIAGMILDSPFSDLVDLMMELVDTYKFRLPKFTVSKCIFWWELFFILQGFHMYSALSTVYSGKICYTVYAESYSEKSKV